MSQMFLLRRQRIGPVPENLAQDAEAAFGRTLGIDLGRGTLSFYERVRKEYRYHTAQYWLVASLANGLLWAQIVIGAALTALGATGTPSAQTVTIYLGATSTIIAGLLTYFKSRNQPNRSRQFRQALRGVRNTLDDSSRQLHSLNAAQARELATRIIQQYNDALAEAAANYPDLWITLDDLKKFLPGHDDDSRRRRGNTSQRSGTSGTSGSGSAAPEEDGAAAITSALNPPGNQPSPAAEEPGQSFQPVSSGALIPEPPSGSRESGEQPLSPQIEPTRNDNSHAAAPSNESTPGRRAGNNAPQDAIDRDPPRLDGDPTTEEATPEVADRDGDLAASRAHAIPATPRV